MPSNYYDTLGVSKDATENDIKKAFRILSLKHHPDRNGGSEESKRKFQELNQAYETLSDPSKRKQYDFELNGFPPGMGGLFNNMGGFPGGFPGGGGAHHFTHMSHGTPMDDMNDMNNLFNMIFGQAGGMGGMEGMGGMGGMGGPDIRIFHNGVPLFQNLQKPMPIVKNISIKLEDAYSGILFPLEIERQVEQMRNVETETVYINIPAGIDDNEIIILKNKGHVINEDVKGDLKIVVKIDNNTPFIRNGMDLIYKKTITLKESLCGFSFEIFHLNGKKMLMNNTQGKAIIKPNFRKVIPNMGIVREQVTGNMIIEFNVEFPSSLSEEQIEVLEKTL
jgi:DnaJ-class molecular chaperone